MNQQTLKMRALPVTDEEAADLMLVRLWEEAIRALAQQRPPLPATRQAAPVERPARVRYTYD